MKTRLALAVATSGGVGYIPVAPGTFGSAVGLLVWAVLPASPLVHAAAIAIVFVVGCWAGTVAEAHFGRTDPGQVVQVNFALTESLDATERGTGGFGSTGR